METHCTHTSCCSGDKERGRRPKISRRSERRGRGRGEHAAASFNSVPLRSSAAKNAGCFSCLFLPSGLPARRIDCCCLVRELKKGPPLFSMLASVSVYPLPHFFLLFLSCPVYLNGLTLVMGFFGALVRPLLLLATPTTCCHKRESFESRTGWLPATETLLCC